MLDSKKDITLMAPRVRRLFWSLLPMAAALAIGPATRTRADLVIQLSTDNGTTWDTVASASSGSMAAEMSTTFGGFNIMFLCDDSNSPGTTSLAFLQGADLDITNGNSGVATLDIRLSDTGFTNPTTAGANPPVVLDSQIGGTVTTGGADNLLTYQSYVDPANGQGTPTGITTGAQTPNITSTQSYKSDASTLITSGLTGPFSITEEFAVTLDSRSSLGFQTNTNLTPVPEPSGLLLAALGAPCLAGWVCWYRRKPKSA